MVQKSEEVPLGYHPRKCKKGKTYEYVIYNNRLPNPVERLYSFFYMPLDVDKMKRGRYTWWASTISRASARPELSGEYGAHDHSCRWNGTAAGFDSRERHRFPLQHGAHHCRNGSSCKGTEYWKTEHVKEILEARTGRRAGPKVPPEGLTPQVIRLSRIPGNCSGHELLQFGSQKN